LKFRLISFLILGFLFLFNQTCLHAQTTKKTNVDSAQKARARVADSLRVARAHSADSLKFAREHRADSIQTARKRITDSTLAARKYKTSKRYTDSVARARKQKAKAIAKGRQARVDSMAAARKTVADSIALSRASKSDVLKTRQKNRADSLAAVKKYKTSKRYNDSVTIVKRKRTDSIKAVQKGKLDQMAATRKKNLDSAKTSRLHITDSIKTVRAKRLDSLKLVRKGKTDSLAKVKGEKEKMAKAKEKKKADLSNLKLELKMKQKREAWSNKSMLKKSWSPVRRVTQNAFTHYNYYYNANRKMEEAELNMRRAKKENYDSLIGLFPFDPNKDSSLLAADMDSIVHKVSVGIQIHDPRIKWAGDMYLLLGQAYYYKGSYENASIAFRYIISSDEEAKKKHGGNRTGGPSIVNNDKSMLGFLKHQSVHNDAILWLSRTFVTANQIENGESVLSLLASDRNLPENLKGKLAIEKAFAYLASGSYDAASQQLAIAIEDKNIPTWLRVRAAFLNGQLLQNSGNYAAAAQSFEKVLDLFPKIDMEFYARKNIAFNKLLAGNNATDAMASLKKILKDPKYSSYYDQIYFILGKLAVKSNKTDEGITYFTKSTSTPKASKKQKALSFAALGDAYYSTAQYSSAKRAYDSASKYSTSGVKDATVVAAVQKSKLLSEVSGPIKTIADQDSLLKLAAMSKRDQQSVVRSYLRRLEKMREDSITNAETAGVNAVKEDEPPADATNWYFSNPAQMQQGNSDFKRKWGSRPLADNWRRASSLSFANNTTNQQAETEDDIVSSSKDAGLPTEENLLAKIPNTEQQREAAIKLQQRAYIQLARAYFMKMEDYPRTIHTLDTLSTRYPNHNQKEEELYLRYQVAIRRNELDKAQGYAQQMLAKFPNSQYASQMRPSESNPASAGVKAVADYFDETYKLLLQHQYTEAVMRSGVAKKQYNNPVYKKRFEILEASAYTAMGEYDKADTIVAAFIRNNPTDSLAGWAKDVQRYIAEVRSGGKPKWYYEKPIVYAGPDKKEIKDPATDLAKPVKPPVISDIPSSYAYQADSEHYAILLLPGLDSKTSTLKQAIRKFDSSKYAAANLEVILDLYDMNHAVMVVKRFTNATQAQAYMAALKMLPVMGEYKPQDLQVLIISKQNYKKMFADKKAQPYISFYSSYYK
jgi:outer membrane protein assembly factor BamD (BamD/ComL family)